MPSFKHEVLKSVVNTMSLPMLWKLPPINHLRAVLETFTMFSTLPWGMHMEKVDLGEFKAELLIPDKEKERKEIILYLHGGGFVIGSPHTHRGLAGKISKLSGIPSLLIDYRKAPEYPYPAALEDALHAYQYLIQKKKHKPEKVFVIGDSAGGGLVLSLMLKLKEMHLPYPCANVLLSPYVDLVNHDDARQRSGRNDRFMDIFEMRRWATLYAPTSDLNDPLVSPLYGDLSGFPPMLIQASESEVLFEDSKRLSEKAKEQGIDVKFQTWHGLIHWWHMFRGMPEAKDAIGKVAAYLVENVWKKGG